MKRPDLDARFLKTNYAVVPGLENTVHPYLKELYHLTTHQPNFLKNPQSERLLFEDFLPLLINSIPSFSAKSDLRLRTPRRLGLVEQADEYMQSNLKQSITLLDLCKALHTSQRPLNYGFREVYGISPMAYLKAMRLQAVRRQLQMADPTTTAIANIAKEFGFWSLGHFSRDYKTMFGELPSETLHQK